MGAGDALLVVDVQNDFLPGGALGVRDWRRRDPASERAHRALSARAAPDLHLPRLASAGPLLVPDPGWPVAGALRGRVPGAAFAPGLALPPDTPVLSKATESGRDAYSAFDGTDLEERLREGGVRRLFIGGLATDYCVRWTVQDALALGLDAVVVRDAVRAV